MKVVQRKEGDSTPWWNEPEKPNYLGKICSMSSEDFGTVLTEALMKLYNQKKTLYVEQFFPYFIEGTIKANI